jgi:hypothetical protein
MQSPLSPAADMPPHSLWHNVPEADISENILIGEGSERVG